MSLLSPIYPRGPIDVGARLRALPAEGASVPELSGLGSFPYARTHSGTRFVLSATRPSSAAGRRILHDKAGVVFRGGNCAGTGAAWPPAYFTSDWEAARRSVQRLAELEPGTVAPGHGKALTGPVVAEALARLAANLDAVGVPEGVKQQGTLAADA
jgi:hypothetical protein